MTSNRFTTTLLQDIQTKNQLEADIRLKPKWKRIVHKVFYRCSVYRKENLYYDKPDTIKVIFWIPEPNVNYKHPKIAFSLFCGGNYLRIYFDTVLDIQRFITHLIRFFRACRSDLATAIREAMEQWQDLKFLQTKLMYQKMQKNAKK